MATPVVTTRILRRLLSSGAYSRAERVMSRIHPADLGPLLSDLTPDETRTVIDLLFRQRRAASTLKELPLELLPQIFDVVTDERLAEVLSRTEIDDRLELVEADTKQEVSLTCAGSLGRPFFFAQSVCGRYTLWRPP